MTVATPSVSVVVATHDRPDRLRALIDSLERQTLDAGRFEIVIVDDGSTDPRMSQVLDDATDDGRPHVQVIRRKAAEGPAVARNEGWRAARGELVAFTDDDCVATPEWLEHGLAHWERNRAAIVQGRTDPIEAEAHRRTPFSRSQVIHAEGPAYQTCNMFYPRELLERLEGFDESFPLPGGEDTDLAWRGKEAGAPVVFAPDAQVHHAVVEAGPLGMLRYALRWQETIPLFVKHPELRRAQLHRRVFWSPRHEHLLRFLLAIPLARQSRLAALIVAWPYLVRLLKRRSGPLLAPYLIVHDLVETYAVVRGAIRNRVLVI